MSGRRKRHGTVGYIYRPDVDAMASRPWLDAQRASAQGKLDAARVTSFVYSKALAGETVTEQEVAMLLSYSRSRLDTLGRPAGSRRPTQGERERARLALEELCRVHPKLKKHIVFDDNVEDPNVYAR